MICMTIFQERNKPTTHQEVVISVPDALADKVRMYLIANGGGETERKDCYQVRSPFLEFALRDIIAMGNEEVGQITILHRKSTQG